MLDKLSLKTGISPAEHQRIILTTKAQTKPHSFSETQKQSNTTNTINTTYLQLKKVTL